MTIPASRPTNINTIRAMARPAARSTGTLIAKATPTPATRTTPTAPAHVIPEPTEARVPPSVVPPPIVRPLKNCAEAYPVKLLRSTTPRQI